MRISFTGSQLGMTMVQKIAVRAALERLQPSALIHGACIGADDEVDFIAHNLGIQRIIYPSNRFDKSVVERCKQRGGNVIVAIHPMEPLKRNPLMVVASNHLIACPSQPHEVNRSGTWSTIRHGKRILGKEHVEIIKP